MDSVHDYIIRYNVQNDKAVLGIQVLESRLEKLELVIDRIAAKFAGMARSGVGTIGRGGAGIGAGRVVGSGMFATGTNPSSPMFGGMRAPFGGGGGGSRSGGGSPGAIIPGPGRGFAGSVLRTGAMYVGYRAVAAVSSAMGEGSREAADYNLKAADDATRMRENLRDIAAVEGISNTEAFRRQMQMQSKIPMRSDDLVKFRTQYSGAIGASIVSGGITSKLADQMMPEVATFAARKGIPSDVAGKLGGLMGLTSKVSSVDEGMSTIGKVSHALSVLGVGTSEELFGPFQQLMGQMVSQDGGKGGKVGDMVTLSALLAGGSTKDSPEMAKTRILQARSALRRFKGQSGDTMRRIGINPEMPYTEALSKIAPYISGPGGDMWLLRHGWHELRGTGAPAALITQAKLYETVVKPFLATEGLGKAGADALPGNRRYENEPLAKTITGDEMKAVSAQKQGIRVEALRAARAAAHGRLADPDRPGGRAIDTGYTNWTDKLLASIPFSTINNTTNREDREAFNELRRQAVQAGMKDTSGFPQRSRTEPRSGTTYDTWGGWEFSPLNPNWDENRSDLYAKLKAQVDELKSRSSGAEIEKRTRSDVAGLGMGLAGMGTGMMGPGMTTAVADQFAASVQIFAKVVGSMASPDSSPSRARMMTVPTAVPGRP